MYWNVKSGLFNVKFRLDILKQLGNIGSKQKSKIAAAAAPNFTGTSRQRIWFSSSYMYMLSPVRLSSVTLVHPTQPVEIFRNFSTPFGTLTIR